MITPEQCRAARAMLGWSRETLCRLSNVSMSALFNFETGRRKPIPANATVLQTTLEDAGIEFLNGRETQGVQLNAAPHGRPRSDLPPFEAGDRS